MLKVTREAAGQFILQPQCTDNPQNICEGVITNALQSYSKKPDEAVTDAMRVVRYCVCNMMWAAAPWVALCN